MSMVQDTDLNEEFNRDTHLIMDLPMRNRHSIKQVIEYCLVAILSHSTVQTQCMYSSHVFTNSDFSIYNSFFEKKNCLFEKK